MSKVRCAWAGADLLYIAYHDDEWGVPVHDDRKLFEFLVLEGMQAGLSWMTILKKRENFRRAFDNFDPHRVADYDEQKISTLLADAGIIRNRAKINATVTNAQAFLHVQKEFGSFDAYMWGFVDGRPIQNAWKSMNEIPAQTDLSVQLSKDLLRRGFRFVGPTIIYAHMQATGMVNDHAVDCFRYAELAGRIVGGQAKISHQAATHEIIKERQIDVSQQDKDQLIGQLVAARSATREVIKNADLNIVAHSDSGWRARDVLGHMAAWDYEAAASLRAYQDGRQYQVQADPEAFNQQSYQKRRDLSSKELMADFDAAHEAFKSALLVVSADKVGGQMTFAWGDHGTVSQMVAGMILHEEEHCHEIAQALRARS